MKWFPNHVKNTKTGSGLQKLHISNNTFISSVSLGSRHSSHLSNFIKIAMIIYPLYDKTI